MTRLREVLRMILRPASQIKEEEEKRFQAHSRPIREHLRKLEQTAIRHVQESTDEAAEFRHEPRT